MTNDQGNEEWIAAHADEFPDSETDFETREHRYDRLHRKERREKGRKRMQEKRGTKQFRVWDGEGSSVPDGERQPYMLFGWVKGNGSNEYIKAKQLRTKQCLDMILASSDDCINVGFSISYDNNQILCDLKIRELSNLARRNSTRWGPNREYRIEVIPHKWFRVSREINGKTVSRTIFDVFNYFNCALTVALDEYIIGDYEEREFLRKQKAARPDFTWEEIDEVIQYWQLENRLTVELMELMRTLFNRAGFYPASWHGPAALSKDMLKRHGIKDCMSDTRKEWLEVWIAALYAMCGGRFQQWIAGWLQQKVYNYDIHSAYPYAIQFLPNLATGKWHRNLHVDRAAIRRDRFCLYHIKYDGYKHEFQNPDFQRRDRLRPRPLFRRTKNDNVLWHREVEGWYWSPEAELIKDDPAAEVIESWEYEDDGTRPFAFMGEYYRIREHHKASGDAIEYAFKLAMNAAYGALAQRTGWEKQRKAPQWHQIEWAGYVTSMCRAMVHEVASYAYKYGELITIDTDGIYCTTRIPNDILPNGIGDGLGQWEEKEYDDMLIWQNGFYWLKKNGEWKTCKSRGAPRGTVPIEAAWAALPNLEPIRYEKKIFVGFKLALRQMGIRNWRSWVSDPHEVVFGGGPGSKMQHSGNPHHKPGERKIGTCPTCAYRTGSTIHYTFPRPLAASEKLRPQDFRGTWSFKFKLPWIEEDKDSAIDPLDDPDLLKIYGDMTL